MVLAIIRHVHIVERERYPAFLDREVDGRMRANVIGAALLSLDSRSGLHRLCAGVNVVSPLDDVVNILGERERAVARTIAPDDLKLRLPLSALVDVGATDNRHSGGANIPHETVPSITIRIGEGVASWDAVGRAGLELRCGSRRDDVLCCCIVCILGIRADSLGICAGKLTAGHSSRRSTARIAASVDHKRITGRIAAVAIEAVVNFAASTRKCAARNLHASGLHVHSGPALDLATRNGERAVLRLVDAVAFAVSRVACGNHLAAFDGNSCATTVSVAGDAIVGALERTSLQYELSRAVGSAVSGTRRHLDRTIERTIRLAVSGGVNHAAADRILFGLAGVIHSKLSTVGHTDEHIAFSPASSGGADGLAIEVESDFLALCEDSHRSKLHIGVHHNRVISHSRIKGLLQRCVVLRANVRNGSIDLQLAVDEHNAVVTLTLFTTDHNYKCASRLAVNISLSILTGETVLNRVLTNRSIDFGRESGHLVTSVDFKIVSCDCDRLLRDRELLRRSAGVVARASQSHRVRGGRSALVAGHRVVRARLKRQVADLHRGDALRLLRAVVSQSAPERHHRVGDRKRRDRQFRTDILDLVVARRISDCCIARHDLVLVLTGIRLLARQRHARQDVVINETNHRHVGVEAFRVGAGRSLRRAAVRVLLIHSRNRQQLLKCARTSAFTIADPDPSFGGLLIEVVVILLDCSL